MVEIKSRVTAIYIYICLFYYSDRYNRYNIYKYKISIIGEDSTVYLAYLYLKVPVTFVYRYSKNKKTRCVYIHCCELTVPAVKWVLRHKLGYIRNRYLFLVSCNRESTLADTDRK